MAPPAHFSAAPTAAPGVPAPGATGSVNAAKGGGSSADRFVGAAQALVALAFAVGLSVQFGINPWFSASAVVAVIVALSAIRHSVGASARRAAPVGPSAERRTKRPGRAAVPVAVRPSPQRITPATRPQQPPDRQMIAESVNLNHSNTPSPVQQRVSSGSHPELRTERPMAPPLDSRTAPHIVPSLPPELPAQAYGTSDPMQGYWSVQPGAPRLVQPSPPPIPVAAGTDELRETDVEIIQKLIRKLADDVNASEAGATVDVSSVSPTVTMAIEPPSLASSPPPSPPPLPIGVQSAQVPPEFHAAIENSLEALRVTADSMRSSSDVVFRTSAPPPMPHQPVPLATAPSVAAVAPPPLPDQAASRAALMAEAISAGRIDVMLEPILGLDDRDARHFEVSIRLRDASGQVLDSSPSSAGLSGTGLLPLFDAARLQRTLNVATKLNARGKSGSIFSTYSAEALDSRAFLADAAEAMHRGDAGTGQLVLTFSQADVRSFGHPQWDAMDDMRALGFRFALAGITDFDIDFEALAGLGFGFAKLEADVFLDGLVAPSGLIPPSDVCRHLSAAGLTLIVEQINDPDKLARIFGFGVLFGQGQLFGGPRALKQDAAVRPTGQAVA
jgi:cyclic-di-GMP phosphodiesterase, flagellum assembly factor TipF